MTTYETGESLDEYTLKCRQCGCEFTTQLWDWEFRARGADGFCCGPACSTAYAGHTRTTSPGQRTVASGVPRGLCGREIRHGDGSTGWCGQRKGHADGCRSSEQIRAKNEARNKRRGMRS